MRNLVVPDASVVLKWVLGGAGEKDRECADAILNGWLDGGVDIVLPRLWAFEVGNVTALRDPSRAEELMEILLGYRFAEAETTPELCRETFGLMRRWQTTFYDAVYHATALLHDGLLVTADEAYCRKAGGKGGVVLLRDYRPTL